MQKAIIRLIRFYQTCLRSFFPAACRHYPSCSEYTLQAIERYGISKGIVLGLGRILRCNPFCRGGYDPA